MADFLLSNIASAIFGAVFTSVIDFFKNTKGYIKIWFGLLGHRKERIRFSCGYLFRIKMDNRYLLIKGKRIEQFQPIGGVYKYYSSFNDIKNSLNITEEQNSTFYEDGDLRVYVPGKNVLKFIRWFNSGKNREVNVTREFYEELIVPGYIPENAIIDAKFEFIKQAECKLGYSNAFRCKEVLIHNIYEVTFSDPTYLEKLNNVIDQGEKSLRFVSQSDIEREAVEVNGVENKIGAHAKNVV